MSDNPFPTSYQEFIYKSRYARYLHKEERRESWRETVDRYLSFMRKHVLDDTGFDIGQDLYDEIFHHIYTLKVMPSMRSLMTAGEALRRDNTAGYNCSYLPVDDLKSFDEAMYILMCGTGVGFSVERQYVAELPEVPDKIFESDTMIVVKDSKEGWAKALRQLIALLYAGEVAKWDISRVRPAGSRLKVFGGRASGPLPLVSLFEFVVATFKGAQGRKLSSIEAHDIMCKIGEVVVVGGVRRSAMISLSNLSDDRMRHAKSGQWWDANPQRALANNSVAYTETPDVGPFMREWTALYDSKSGERGIFNREATQKQASRNERRKSNIDFGINPCSEIILRPYQFCNLSEVVVRQDDTKESLKKKVEIATVLGTMQATLTNFPYLRKVWKHNTEEERLLGVSLTGIMDCKLTNGIVIGLDILLQEIREHSIVVNAKMSESMNVPQSTAITCVKPSGTVSQLVDSASGIHARHSEYYIRSVRCDNKDPITNFMKAFGVYSEPDVTKPDATTVFFFPVKAPGGSVLRNDLGAIQQLELWKIYQEHWCEHKPSVTISVKEHEWPSVGGWVYDNFDTISGVSFLPYSEHTYRQAPYTECTKEVYEELLVKTPSVLDWNKLVDFEKEDTTSGSKTMSCSADNCEIVDLI